MTTQPFGASFLSGYGIKIRALRQEDLVENKIDIGNSNPLDCVAIDGEDLAVCLAAIVDCRRKLVVWGDATGHGDAIPSVLVPGVVAAVRVLISALIEGGNDLLSWVDHDNH